MIEQLIINGLIAGSIYALVALGFVIIYRTVRFFHLAHGAVIAIGAYLAWFAVSELGMPLILGAVFASFGAGLIGMTMNCFIYRPLRRRKSPNLVLLLASFGILIFITNLIQIIFGADMKNLRSGPISVGNHLFGAVITNTQIMIVLISLLLAFALMLFLKTTRLGKAIRAVADDSVAASIVGINSEKIITIVFFLGSILAGAAGVIVSLETNIIPAMGMNVVIKGIIAAVIGGVGSIRGALIGGLLIGLAENIGIWGISAGWKDAISFSILVLFLIFRPGGLFRSVSEQRQI